MKKEDIKVIVTVDKKGNLSVDSNISAIGTAGLLSEAVTLALTDIAKKDIDEIKAKTSNPESEEK